MKTLKVFGVVVVFILAGLVGYASWKGFVHPSRAEEPMIGAANAPVNSTFNTSTDSYLNYGTQDVCGSHIGTTTIGCTQTPNVTSSFISDIGFAKQATYQIYITSATTSQNITIVTVQGSNDYLCATLAGNASSTTDVVQKNIHWYDAMTFEGNRVHPTSFSTGSTTLFMVGSNLAADSALTLNLVNLNFRCLKFLMSVSSTLPYVGINVRN